MPSSNTNFYTVRVELVIYNKQLLVFGTFSSARARPTPINS